MQIFHQKQGLLLGVVLILSSLAEAQAADLVRCESVADPSYSFEIAVVAGKGTETQKIANADFNCHPIGIAPDTEVASVATVMSEAGIPLDQVTQKITEFGIVEESPAELLAIQK